MGIQNLRDAFPHRKVNVIDIRSMENILHLKSVCSLCADSHIVVGGEYGPRIANEMDLLSNGTYRYTLLPDEGASNCILVNGTLIRRARIEFPASADALDSIGGVQIEIVASELAKVDGALTCAALLTTSRHNTYDLT